MARFVFQLDGLLRHRQWIEKDRQRELAIAQSEVVRLEHELRAISDEVARSASDMRDNHLVGRLDMNYLAAHRRYMLGMQRKTLAQAQKIAAQQKLVEDARRTLAEASRQRKMLEKLKERYFQRWSEARARREAGELDELTTQLACESLGEQWEDAT